MQAVKVRVCAKLLVTGITGGSVDDLVAITAVTWYKRKQRERDKREVPWTVRCRPHQQFHCHPRCTNAIKSISLPFKYPRMIKDPCQECALKFISVLRSCDYFLSRFWRGTVGKGSLSIGLRLITFGMGLKHIKLRKLTLKIFYLFQRR